MAAAELQQQHLVKKIMEEYDADNSGNLSRAELVPMLNDYSIQVFGKECSPSQDDMSFLLKLFKGENDKLDRVQVLNACEAWGEFVKQKSFVSKTFDLQNRDCLDAKELQEFLDELNKSTIVPSEVTSWVMKQADVSGEGVLTAMELVRAIYAFNLWRSRGEHEEEEYCRSSMYKGIRLPRDLPPPTKANCMCIIS